MIGRSNGGAGGSGGTTISLNVIGSATEPSNPKDNDIWVVTSVSVTGYSYSVAAPSDPDQGMVWIRSSNSSPASFDLLLSDETNSLVLYPIAASVYNNGTWEACDCFVYTNSQWTDVFYWIYNNGDNCYEITGGYNATANWSFGTASMSCSMTTGNTTFDRATWSINPIDCSRFKKFYIDCNPSGTLNSAYGQVYVGLGTNANNNTFTTSQNLTTAGRQLVEFDISTITTSLYPKFNVRKGTGTGVNTTTALIVYAAYFQ